MLAFIGSAIFCVVWEAFKGLSFLLSLFIYVSVDIKFQLQWQRERVIGAAPSYQCAIN